MVPVEEGEQPKEVEEGEVATKEVLAEQCQRTILPARAPRMPAIISAHLQLQATQEMGRSVLHLHKWRHDDSDIPERSNDNHKDWQRHPSA